MGPTILFTQLKIILLQCFQFSATISSIQTDPLSEVDYWEFAQHSLENGIYLLLVTVQYTRLQWRLLNVFIFFLKSLKFIDLRIIFKNILLENDKVVNFFWQFFIFFIKIISIINNYLNVPDNINTQAESGKVCKL